MDNDGQKDNKGANKGDRCNMERNTAKVEVNSPLGQKTRPKMDKKTGGNVTNRRSETTKIE